MTPSSTNQSKETPGSDIPYERFLDCVHCGLCTSSCPTYVETGNENDSPRGRIHLMRSVVDGRLPLSEKVQGHLDLCLDCRSCETACPSGVQYGRLLEPFKVAMHSSEQNGPTKRRSSSSDWFHRWILHGLFPYRGRLKWALLPARMMQVLRIDRLIQWSGLPRLLPQRLQRMHRQLPILKPTLPELPEYLAATTERQFTVALFTGCVADAMFRHVHWATVRVLQKNGCDVQIPKNQECCGAIHYHSAAAEPTAKLMQHNTELFRSADVDAVIMNVAGCGAMLKDYVHIAEEMNLGSIDQFSLFSKSVCDISEFLAEHKIAIPAGRIDARIVYQDACHLQHAQQIRQAPRQLLNLIPGVKLIEVEEAELCCGAAGSYNLTQPEMSDRLGNRKLDHLLAAKPDIISSANVGCSLQLQALLKERGLRIPVVHPIELLDLSYRQGDWKTELQ